MAETVQEAPGATADRKKMKHQNTILIVVGLIGLVVTIIIAKSRAAAAGGSSIATGNPVPSTGLLAGGSSTTTATDPYAESMLTQLQGQQQAQSSALQGFQTMLSNMGAQIETNPPAPASAGPAAPAASPAYNPPASYTPPAALTPSGPASSGPAGPTYQHISTMAQSTTLEAAGYTVYGQEPGNVYIPLWQKAGGTTAAFKPYATAANPGLFYNPAQKV